MFEILIVVVLIGMAFAAMSLQIPKALKAERFETAVGQVIAKISLVQELMLDYHADASLTLTQHERGIQCSLKVDQPIAKKLKSQIEKEVVFGGIDEIAFDEQPAGEIILLFDATLGATPKGKLLLASKKQKTTLILRGFPSKIIRDNYEFPEEKQTPYPEEILSAL